MKKLNDGQQIPELGFGAMIYSEQASYRAVSMALTAGYRLIDTAEAYHNESAVGRAIKDSQVPREQVFLTTKLWPSQEMNGAAVAAHLKQSLDNLQQDYIDLYLVHEPYGDLVSIWQAMIALKQQGKAKSIGVSNFSAQDIQTIVAATGVKPAVNQIESHPWDNENELVKFCLQQHIQPESWASLAEGKHGIFHNKLLQKIGQSHQKTIAQVVLRWEVDRGLIPLAKSSKRQRIEENLNVLDFKLSPAEISQINSLNTGVSLWPNY